MKYNRKEWIEHWPEHGGVNLRQLLIAKHSVHSFICPYSGQISLIKNSQVDHIVPLGYVAENGHFDSPNKKFARDTENLILVSSHANESKGERGILDFVPEHVPFRRNYAVLWRYIFTKYGLHFTEDEQDLIDKLLGSF